MCGSTSKRELIYALDKSLPELFDTSSRGTHSLVSSFVDFFVLVVPSLHPVTLLRKSIRGMDQIGQLQFKDSEIKILK